MASHNCKDHYVNCNDGTLDKQCTVCGNKVKQAVMYLSELETQMAESLKLQLNRSGRRAINVH